MLWLAGDGSRGYLLSDPKKEEEEEEEKLRGKERRDRLTDRETQLGARSEQERVKQKERQTEKETEIKGDWELRNRQK